MGRGPTKKYHKKMIDGYVNGTLTCLKDTVIKRESNTDFPLVLNIEPTNDCNLRCYVCPRRDSGREVGYITMDLFKKIVDEAAQYKKLRMLNLHKDGESLLHPQLGEMIRYARKKDISQVIHLNTNGTLLTARKAAEIIDSGLDDLTISLDALTEKTYKKIKGSGGFYALEKKIVQLFELRDKMGSKTPFIRVKIMEFGDTVDEIKGFVRKWTPVADQVQVTGVHSWSGAIESLGVTDEHPPERYPCSLMWFMLAVNWNGPVSICSVDWNLTTVVGDIRENTLHEIWNGDRMKAARLSHLEGRWGYLPVCKECIVWGSGPDITEWARSKREFYILSTSKLSEGKPRVAAIIQARMASTRLPGKVLINIQGKPLLERVIERVKKSKLIDEIIIATTTNEKDRAIIELARAQGLPCYSGSEDDVLDRFYQTAREFHADVIVRITSDDPLKDPEVIDRVVGYFLDNRDKFDYVSNNQPPTYPEGLDVEVFSFNALEKAWQEARKPSEREHVTPFIWNHSEIFRLKNIENYEDLSSLRWTLDNESDLRFMREVYARFNNSAFLMKDILSLLRAEPEVARINQGIPRNEGYLNSLKKERGR
jgi:spore coat polysaccharide biosynthesis protein SpsF